MALSSYGAEQLSTTDHLARSIELAAEAGGHGNRPYGAVIVAASGDILAEGRNEVAATGDVTAHAELMAIQQLTAGQLAGATVYASGEPCPMCAAACVWAGVARIVFAASASACAAVLSEGPRIELSCADVAGAYVEVEGPARESDAVEAMRASILTPTEQT
ncbi:tRNA-specific adenosine deaminase [Rhodococcoides trifolii]|uniref:tRNA-specific adenosine deaminase n=1 Tax=Rhodococcoides trifolii TaxID=908250 RepID=A0A917CUD1_9NOCA|nr:nucleoside deaminase [Rhodococcus trifolii]GGF99934.1 tRNA-specific adenosine deaminase [Rhodococcus trifolii]